MSRFGVLGAKYPVLRSGFRLCTLYLGLCTCLSSCATTGGGAAATAAERHWRMAQGYLERGMVRHARDEAAVVLRLDPGHAGAREMLGAAAAAEDGTVEPGMLLGQARRAYRESRILEARRLADQLLLSDPGNDGARGLLKDMEEEKYQPSPLGVNDVLEGLYEKGMTFYRKGEWAAAAEVFQNAHVTSPSHEQSWKYFNLCRARAEESNVAVALKRARESIAAGKKAEARDTLHRVLEVDPEHAEALALLESLGEDRREAERRARARKHFNAGVTAYERGRWADAIREWEMVLSIMPGDQEAERLLRRARGKLSAEKQAAKKRIPGMHRRARTLYQQGKLEEAARIYREILEIDPADEQARGDLDLIDSKLAEP